MFKKIYWAFIFHFCGIPLRTYFVDNRSPAKNKTKQNNNKTTQNKTTQNKTKTKQHKTKQKQSGKFEHLKAFQLNALIRYFQDTFGNLGPLGVLGQFWLGYLV